MESRRERRTDGPHSRRLLPKTGKASEGMSSLCLLLSLCAFLLSRPGTSLIKSSNDAMHSASCSLERRTGTRRLSRRRFGGFEMKMSLFEVDDVISPH